MPKTGNELKPKCSQKGPVIISMARKFKPVITVSDTGNWTNGDCLDDDGMKMKAEVAWWSEYLLLQTIVGIAGLLANTIAIPVLNTKEVSKHFKRNVKTSTTTVRTRAYLRTRFVGAGENL